MLYVLQMIVNCFCMKERPWGSEPTPRCIGMRHHWQIPGTGYLQMDGDGDNDTVCVVPIVHRYIEEQEKLVLETFQNISTQTARELYIIDKDLLTFVKTLEATHYLKRTYFIGFYRNCKIVYWQKNKLYLSIHQWKYLVYFKESFLYQKLEQRSVFGELLS